ncbi:GGDEF domain-containing protein [Acinetobacter sp. ANC 4945]|uniref:diguanylate cyclase n=1 Tax=Acinetobacter amyesii TaxID=2942470 RepID=A0A1T1GWA8_9GAMM|nr:sensor domain-containing diguanylate cyclase [Acinetobacter amyesii]MCL6247208.1 GGDEF domain-containing protein [Acinetobacter amyesii]OOV81901.1 deoxycytidine triphosphate deaminase [Acinetobacter amyesii]
MINIEQMAIILDALPDPAFIISRSGKYVAVFGGRDNRYYHDGSGLVGTYISDVIKPDKANLFMQLIDQALTSGNLLIEEYELSNRDVKGLPDYGPEEPIWFEVRIQALSFSVDEEDVVLWVASNISARHNLEIKLKELSHTDQLTGLFNRRKLEHDLALHYESYRRHSIQTSILMFDLDNLKKINDSKGHHVGDEAIRAVADILRLTLRKTDCACRLGGDEFVVALPNTGCEQAIQFAKRIHEHSRKELSRFSIDNAHVTVSIGVTTITPEDCSYEDTIKRADLALYKAKHGGKNRIVAA